MDILSYDDIQLDWVPGDGDLRSGGDLKKVYGDQGYVLCIWDKDVPLDVGDTVTMGGSTVPSKSTRTEKLRNRIMLRAKDPAIRSRLFFDDTAL